LAGDARLIELLCARAEEGGSRTASMRLVIAALAGWSGVPEKRRTANVSDLTTVPAPKVSRDSGVPAI
jgi:hypothetical protein